MQILSHHIGGKNKTNKSLVAQRLTWADVSVAIQIPVHWKLSYFVWIFDGLVADVLAQTRRKVKG